MQREGGAVSNRVSLRSYEEHPTLLPTKSEQPNEWCDFVRKRRFFWILTFSVFVIAAAITVPIIVMKRPPQVIRTETTVLTTTVTYTTISTTTTTTTVSRVKPTIYDRSYLTNETVWVQEGITVAGGNKEGDSLNQFRILGDIHVNENDTIYAGDFGNQRLIKWPLNAFEGEIILDNTLYYPRDFVYNEDDQTIVICDSMERNVLQISVEDFAIETILSEIDCYGIGFDQENNLYVSDDVNHHVRRWELGSKRSDLVAGGHGKGNQSNQLAHPTSIFVDDQQSVYVSDFGNRRIMKWEKDATKGRIIATHENGLHQLESVGSILVDHLGNVYVSDWAVHRVLRCNEGRKRCETIAGGRDGGSQANQLHFPGGLAFDKYGHLYVADRLNYRIQKFPIDFY